MVSVHSFLLLLHSGGFTDGVQSVEITFISALVSGDGDGKRKGDYMACGSEWREPKVNN